MATIKTTQRQVRGSGSGAGVAACGGGSSSSSSGGSVSGSASIFGEKRLILCVTEKNYQKSNPHIGTGIPESVWVGICQYSKLGSPHSDSGAIPIWGPTYLFMGPHRGRNFVHRLHLKRVPTFLANFLLIPNSRVPMYVQCTVKTNMAGNPKISQNSEDGIFDGLTPWYFKMSPRRAPHSFTPTQ